MQVRFEYILVIKNSSDINQVKVPLIELRLSCIPPQRHQCSQFGVHPLSHTYYPLGEHEVAPNSHFCYKDRLSFTWGSLCWFCNAPFLSRATGKTDSYYPILLPYSLYGTIVKETSPGHTNSWLSVGMALMSSFPGEGHSPGSAWHHLWEHAPFLDKHTLGFVLPHVYMSYRRNEKAKNLASGPVCDSVIHFESKGNEVWTCPSGSFCGYLKKVWSC